MAEIRWTTQAVEDIEEIACYIAQDSPRRASLFAARILASVERLARFPYLGRVLPEMADPEIRELLLGDYRIAYRVNGERVEILAVWHGSRFLDLERLE